MKVKTIVKDKEGEVHSIFEHEVVDGLKNTLRRVSVLIERETGNNPPGEIIIVINPLRDTLSVLIG